MFKGKLLVSLAAALFLLTAVAKPAAAQYPTPQGGLFCSSSTVIVQQNSSFTFSATLVDISGNAVQGQYISFTVQSSNGGAYLSSGVAYTDWSGMASTTVYTGSATGQIVVYANSGSFNCSTVVQVPDVPHITCYITQIALYQYSFVVVLRSSSGYFVGQSITYSITSTGGGASLASGGGITDASGSASVAIYSVANSGNITVSANSNGQFCQASVAVPPPPQTIVYPAPRPERPSYIAPPYTGDAGLTGGSQGTSYSVIAALGLLSLGTAAVGGKFIANRISDRN